jgi:hypothetical protein
MFKKIIIYFSILFTGGSLFTRLKITPFSLAKGGYLSVNINFKMTNPNLTPL